MSSLEAGYAAMAADARMHFVQRRAERELRTAEEHHHGRTIAVLVAALSKSFQPVWDLKFELAAILRKVQQDHEAARAVVLAALESARAKTNRCFFRFWKTYGRVCGTRINVKFTSAEAAEAVRLQAINLARGAQLGDELEVTNSLRRPLVKV